LWTSNGPAGAFVDLAAAGRFTSVASTGVAEEFADLADRPGWQLDGTGAVYAPTANGWRARINRTIVPGRSYHRLHVAVIDPAGHARHVVLLNQLSEARRVAEAQVNARNAA